MVLFMPMPATTVPKLTGIACVMTMSLPAWLLFPDPTRGRWMDCYRDPDKVRILNTFLWLMSCADTAAVTVYIEILPDIELMENGVVTITRFYRVFVPLTEMDARNMSAHMATRLTTAAEETTGRAAKRARLQHEAEAVDLQENHSRMNNTMLGKEYINSEAALLQYVATARSGAVDAQWSTIDFSAPPNTGFLDGGGALDSSDEETGGETDDGDDIVTDVFDAFYENLPRNHVLKLFDINDGFLRGTQRFNGLAPDQLEITNYWSNHTFTFPNMCAAQQLVVIIRSGWPGMEDNVNNLVHNYALPAATLRMCTEELFCKMQSMHAINGSFVPREYRDLPIDELKQIWLEQGIENTPHGHVVGHDPSYYTPIEMLPTKDTRDDDLQITKSDEILWAMYPGLDRLAGGISHEYHRMCKARKAGHITPTQMDTWREDVIRRMDQLFAGDPKEGFVESYFHISRETNTLMRAFNRRTHDRVTAEAIRMLRTNIPGMNAGNSLQCVLATLLQGPLHLTQAQASVASFIWHGTLTAMMPVTNCLQPIVCLFGPPDSGKSAIMELVVNVLILSAACICRDTHSKMAMTAHTQLGVQLIDELKIGVQDSSGADTNWLTALSRGVHIHERLTLATRPGEVTHNEVVMSDRRGMQVTATNSVPYDNFKSRMISIYCSGTQNPDSRSRQELSTIPDNTNDYYAAVKVFQYIWAMHSEIYKIQQCMHFTVVTVFAAVWFGLAKKVLGATYTPAPRQLVSVKRMAQGFMNARLVAEYDRLPEADKPSSIVAYAMANPMLKMQDLMAGYVGLEKNTDNDHETAIVVRTLKESILMQPGGLIDLQPHGPDHYVTSKKTIEELTAATGELKSATGIVADVHRQLSRVQGTGGVAGVTMVNKRGDFQGHMAIHKSLIGGLDATSMIKAQQTILQFLTAEVLAEKTNAQQLRMWYVDMDESWVVFPRQVKEVLLNRYKTTGNRFEDSPTLRQAQLSADAVARAFCIWEAAGIIQFRDRDVQPDTLNSEGITIVSASTAGAVRVDRGGPCDANSLLPDYGITPDNEMTDEWMAEQMQAASITKRPPPRPYKSPLRLLNVLKVKTELLRPYLDHALKQAYGLDGPPVALPSRQGRQDAICRLWDTVMAVSGEIKPGGVVNMGISHRSTKPYETHTIRQLLSPTVTMLNPRRRSDDAAVTSAADADSVVDELLDPAVTLLTFPTNPEVPLIDVLQAKAAAANGM